MPARRKMTKAEAGKRGGIATCTKYGRDYMSKIGRNGAVNMHKKYELRPFGTSYFILVNRETGDWSGKTIEGVHIVAHRQHLYNQLLQNAHDPNTRTLGTGVITVNGYEVIPGANTRPINEQGFSEATIRIITNAE